MSDQRPRHPEPPTPKLSQDTQRARGDFQTPTTLAQQLCAIVATHLDTVEVVVEPTCGQGAFLRGAQHTWSHARLLGFELNPDYAAEAQRTTPSAQVRVADFFEEDWATHLAALPAATLVLGNPPWVTNATQARLGALNLPPKTNRDKTAGIEAITGASNFDISEWMMLRLLAALEPRGGALGMVCKAAVARKILERGARSEARWRCLGFWPVNAQRHFGAVVDAGFLLMTVGPEVPSPDCPVYRMGEDTPHTTWGLRAGRLRADVACYDTVRPTLAGRFNLRWRSGVKHDCARVFQLSRGPKGWVNGLGERVQIEAAHRLPFMKATDLARGRAPTRALVVPQRDLQASVSDLADRAPKTWAYLNQHGAHLRRRKSRIYKNAPLSVFGVGAYSFTAWKVAVSGMHPEPVFRAIGPHEGQPVLFDDTCYLVPCDDEAQARALADALNDEAVQRLLKALVFAGSKRPFTARVLSELNVAPVAAL